MKDQEEVDEPDDRALLIIGIIAATVAVIGGLHADEQWWYAMFMGIVVAIPSLGTWILSRLFVAGRELGDVLINNIGQLPDAKFIVATIIGLALLVVSAYASAHIALCQVNAFLLGDVGWGRLAILLAAIGVGCIIAGVITQIIIFVCDSQQNEDDQPAKDAD